jgi:hypothetical protein
MAKCDTCGNEYDKTFVVTVRDKSYTFDSFECAIHKLAPTCEHCRCRIIGHGVESQGHLFCCVHCANHTGDTSLRDRE